jgi:hypothetical protein
VGTVALLICPVLLDSMKLRLTFWAILQENKETKKLCRKLDGEQVR